jgi:cytosine/adenosine deaminase-related metal-dependent hydrolase
VIRVYGPWLFDGQEFVEGGVAVEDGIVADVSSSPPEDITHRCIVFPMLANAHTHLGDAFVKKVPRGAVEDIVAPPHGFKFKMLAKATRAAVERGMAGAVDEMARTGTGAFADLRENGLPGVRALKKAVGGRPVDAVILGRPRNLVLDDAELRSIVSAADGVGLSGIAEWKRDDLLEISRAVRKAGKVFAIHASEREREPFERVAELEPAFVVHMLRAEARDLRACADLAIPVVVCPRSNAFFGFKPPVRRMLDAGIEVALGTDNAMLARPDMLAEARFLAKTQRDIRPAEAVRIAVSVPRKVLNLEPGFRPKRGGPARFAALPCGRGDPARAFLAPGKRPLAVEGARQG